MEAPVRLVAPSASPVSLAEAKGHLRVDHSDDDLMIQSLIEAATDHLDGWTGILGRALMRQQWQQGFAGFHVRMRLPLGPVLSVDSVTYTDPDGAEQTVPVAQYDIARPAGFPEIVTRAAFSWPSLSSEVVSPVRVTYTAGYASAAEVPAAIRHAILLHVGTLYEYRETMAENVTPTRAYEALVAPYRVA